MITDIAMAHGGFNEDGDRDTIGSLPYENPPRISTGRTGEVRVKKLAAILRFADEIADDNTRTSRFLVDTVGRVRPESEIFHVYAERLTPPKVCHDSRSIELTFELNPHTVQHKYQKYGIERYLFDEICDRTLKMYREHLYCRRFLLPEIVFEQIIIKIVICTDDYSRVLDTIQYTMMERGYPRLPCDIADVCPEFTLNNGAQLASHVARLLSIQNGM